MSRCGLADQTIPASKHRKEGYEKEQDSQTEAAPLPHIPDGDKNTPRNQEKS
jgi:hypothetical protein